LLALTILAFSVQVNKSTAAYKQFLLDCGSTSELFECPTSPTENSNAVTTKVPTSLPTIASTVMEVTPVTKSPTGKKS